MNFGGSIKNLSNRWLLIGFGVLMVLGMSGVIFFGLKPRPLEHIRLSSFDDELVAANSIKLRLWQVLRQSNRIFLGFDPADEIQVKTVKQLMGILKTAEMGSFLTMAQTDFLESRDADEFKMDYLINLDMPKEQILKAMDSSNFVEAGKEANLVILAPLLYASQTVMSSPALITAEDPKNRVLSIVFSWFPRSRDEESKVKNPCLTAPQETPSLGRLGCFILQSSRTSYLKKESGKALIGLMNQVGSFEYLFLVRTTP